MGVLVLMVCSGVSKIVTPLRGWHVRYPNRSLYLLPKCGKGTVKCFCAYGMFRHKSATTQAHYKRLAPACELTRLGEILRGNGRALRAHSLSKSLPYFNRPMLAQELCGRATRWISCAFGMRQHSLPKSLPYFMCTTLAQELCGRVVRRISCAQGMRQHPYHSR
ncbi:hypothetical protein SAMN05421877_112128 [Sphingobacterium lactis]|uniref:Uncharacterized protein n=1 Tax=Sphingobacterium lactis TaxID=797291 RepID=A0A1H6C214_9SPHI|nr:hypothetical protein SAMN05421877_112128 [Sphingobacterium lactis]